MKSITVRELIDILQEFDDELFINTGEDSIFIVDSDDVIEKIIDTVDY